MAKNEPVVKVRDGVLSVAGFANDIKTKDGKTFTKVSFSFQRYYKDDKGEDKYTDSVDSQDLLKVSKLFADAYGKYTEYRASLTKKE